MRREMLSHKELKTIYLIRNAIVHNGVAPSVRELMKALGYRSPRSVSLIIKKLTSKGLLNRCRENGLQFTKEFKESLIQGATVDVPLLGTIACGAPMFAEEDIQAIIPVSKKLVPPPHKYFLLRASGNSMDKRNINDGDLVLVRQQLTANNGDRVVALIDNEATIKELFISDEAIVLKPCSTTEEHKPIILTRDFKIQGVVTTVIPKL